MHSPHASHSWRSTTATSTRVGGGIRAMVIRARRLCQDNVFAAPPGSLLAPRPTARFYNRADLPSMLRTGAAERPKNI
jgi:hypothetical protein